MTARTLLALATCVVGSSLIAQTPVFHAETHLVTLTFTVHDAQGNLVPDRLQDDFNVFEDGVPQKIVSFSHESNMQLKLGLLIDASPSQDKFLHQHLRDMQTFLASVLQPQDRVFAIGFGDHLRIVSDFTADPVKIIDGIHRYYKDVFAFPEIEPDNTRNGGTALFDAIEASVANKFSGSSARQKALILFSDGEENSSSHDEIDAISAAQNADVLVYAIRYTPTHREHLVAADRQGIAILNHVTTQTGGVSFDALHSDLSKDFAQMREELRSLYTVSYYSTNHQNDGAFRKVILEARPVGLTVRARSGYYAR